MSEPAWYARAACRQSGQPDLVNLFFVERGAHPTEAKNLCWGYVKASEDGPSVMVEGCPVRAECLNYALETNQRHGVWGGLTEEERSVVVRRRRKVDRSA